MWGLLLIGRSSMPLASLQKSSWCFGLFCRHPGCKMSKSSSLGFPSELCFSTLTSDPIWKKSFFSRWAATPIVSVYIWKNVFFFWPLSCNAPNVSWAYLGRDLHLELNQPVSISQRLYFLNSQTRKKNLVYGICGVTSVIHSFLFQFFTDTRVGISPAGSAVIGPQIAQYILLRTATKKLIL